MKTTPSPLLVLSILLCTLSPFTARADFFGKLEPQLIQVVDGKKADYKKPATNAKYTAIYYSAHWCPPCRAFTPKLVEWYNEFKPKHKDFELVFASSDKDENAMLEYMTEMKMPWPAIRFSDKKKSGVDKYASDGIPYLVLLNAEGKNLTGAQGNEWQPPAELLKKIEKIVEDKK
jgi:nucleoredoxin